jgi:hypothetical protein
VSLLLDPVEGRLVAVLESNRGGSGMSADAAARAIPAGWFRRVQRGAPLRDPGLAVEAFDRAYQFEWLSIGDDPDPANGLDSTSLRRVTFTLAVGYVYGTDFASFVHRVPSESTSQADSAPRARMRALSDAERIYRALSFNEIVTGDGLDPAIVGIWRDGPSAVEDLGGGRLACLTPYRALILVSAAGSYAP